MEPFHVFVLVVAGFSAAGASVISFWLIMRHQQNMTNISVQSKIVGIIWMIPIYSIDSFLGLSVPQVADYVNMLRDCYEAYVLYLFLSLMLSYMGCEDAECEYRLVTYLEKQPPVKRSFPFNVMCGEELPKGREFLRYCKFGTLQYCVVRPSTTLLAMILDLAGVYHESDLSFHYGYIYILIIMNLSIGYAFIVLASFYTAMKEKLKPYEPVGKFLCIKFVIFFAFWQSVVITGLMKIGWISGFNGYSARQVSVGLQDFLICVEMLVAAVAFTCTFSYQPFTEGYVNPKLAYLSEAEYDEEHEAALDYFTRASSTDLRNATAADGTGRGGSGGSGGQGGRSSSGGGGGSGGTPLTYYSPTVDPERTRAGGHIGGKGKKSAGLMNMIRSGKSVGFPFPAKVGNTATGKSAGKGSSNSTAGKAGHAYQLVDMSGEEAAQTQHVGKTGAVTHNKLHGTYAPPSQPPPPPQQQGSRRIGGHGLVTGDRRHEQSVSQSAAPTQSHAGELLNKHFAANTAIRDFNETMPVVVLPSGFEMHRGMVVNSDPEARLRALEEEDQREQEAER